MGASPGSGVVSGDSSEPAARSSHLAPIWIGVAIAIAVASAVAWNVYRSTTKYANAFDAMMSTSAKIQALDHARADRTLLAVAFQTYQLSGERTALNTLAPLSANLKVDLGRVRAVTASEPLQQRSLDRIDSQLADFNRMYDKIAKLDWKAEPHTSARPAQVDAAGALLDTLRVELAGMSAEEFRLLAPIAAEARARAFEGQLIAAVGCTLIIGWLLVVVGWGSQDGAAA
jgi:CHASE3 domain sensor protein